GLLLASRRATWEIQWPASRSRSSHPEESPVAKKYRVGIIGHTGRGDYGHAVDLAFTKMPNVEIVAVADASEVGRAAAKSRSGAATAYASYRDMLAKEK